MTIKIFYAVLSFSIDRFMKVFPDGRTLPLCPTAVNIDIRNYDCEHLSSGPQVHWTIASWRGPVSIMYAPPRYICIPLTG